MLLKVLTEVDALGRVVPVMSKSSSLRGVEAGKETSYSRFNINSTFSKRDVLLLSPYQQATARAGHCFPKSRSKTSRAHP